MGTSPPLTEVSRALRARNPKKTSRKCLPGPPAPGPQTVSKKSQNTPKTLSRHFPETLRRLPALSPRLFRDFLGVPGPEAPGDIFETFLGFRARRARETSVRGGLVPNGCKCQFCFYGHGDCSDLGNEKQPRFSCLKFLISGRPDPYGTLVACFARSASLALPHLKSFAAIPSVSLVQLGHTNRSVFLSHESQREIALVKALSRPIPYYQQGEVG